MSISFPARGLARRLTPPVAASALAVALCAAYLVRVPVSPDLTGQLARADLVRRAGDVSWWTGWFGGLSLPTYSVITPPVMAVLGVSLTGALATIAGCYGAGVLLRDAPRPRAGAIVFSLFAVADLIAGRVTFVVGAAFAIWALVATRSRWWIPAIGCAVLAYLSSPLAGLFLGITLLAVLITDRGRRGQAALVCGLLLAVAAAMAVLFPGTGVMPYRPTDAIPPAICFAVVAATCPQPVVRTAALLSLGALPVFMLVPGAVGSNIARLAWVAAVPALVACGTRNRRFIAGAALVLAAWPATDIIEQVQWAPGRTAHPGYYQPLVSEVRTAQAAAGPAVRGERVELLDTRDHFGTLYVARSLALARGWDRQADAANNPIFYSGGTLTAATYHRWLRELAVGWVAVPAADLDYGATQEAKLVTAGLPYLRLIWTSPDWRLYRVADATPLAIGATVTEVGPSSVTLHAAAATTVTVRLRWSPYMRVVDAATGDQVPACIERSSDWVKLYLPAGGEYSLVSSFDAAARFRATDDDCAADLRPAG